MQRTTVIYPTPYKAQGFGGKHMGKSESKGGTIIAVVAILAFFVLGLVYLSTPTTELKEAQSTVDTGDAGDDGAASTVQPATVVVQKAKDTDSHRGTINLALLSATGATGSASNVMFLDESYAIYKDAGKTIFDAEATRLSLMKTITDYGASSLKSFASPESAPANNTVASGIWSETVTKKAGDKGLIYTSQGHTAYEVQNATSVRLFTMETFNEGTDVWTISLYGGGDKWNLKNYADYNFVDNSYVERQNYTVNDGGSQLTGQLWNFYTNASAQGEDCYDCAIFLMAPTNITGKNPSLTLTAAGLKPGRTGSTSEKFTTLRPASGVPEVAISYSLLPAKNSSNDEAYFLGFIPDRFLTERSSSEKNRLSWEWKSDTYGADKVGLNFYIIQNARSISTSNGAFKVTATFRPQYSDSASGYDTAP